MSLNTTTYPLAENYSKRFNYNGHECGYGFHFNNYETKILLVHKDPAGRWQALLHPDVTGFNGILMSFMHSGPLAGAGQSYDPDGPSDPLPPETTTFVQAANKYGILSMVEDKLDDANDLLVANWGTYAGGELGDGDEPDSNFLTPDQVNAALKEKFAGKIDFVAGKLVLIN